MQLSGLFLVHNNAFCFMENGVREITEEEIQSDSIDALRKKIRGSCAIVFGGLGFSGNNLEFNADNGVYALTLDRDQEIQESAKFDALYAKISEAWYDQNVIILTHMPIEDWHNKNEKLANFVYVNGHSHRNRYVDDGKVRIFADNQIGYHKKVNGFKKIGTNFDYDYFFNLSDGISEISQDEYVQFYRGINEPVTLSRTLSNIHMLKKGKTYLFIADANDKKPSNYNYLLLSGGTYRRIYWRPLEYYYENMESYAESINAFLGDYAEGQRQISEFIKSIGGSGRIHGAIIDINFWDHIYLNPLDGKATPYSALSMTSKYAYESLPIFLKENCPELYAKYVSLPETKSLSSAIAKRFGFLSNSEEKEFVSETDMYKISRLIKSLQYTLKYKVIRLWNDAIVSNPGASSGRLFILGAVDPQAIEPMLAESKEKAKADMAEARKKLKEEKELAEQEKRKALKEEAKKAKPEIYKQKVAMQTKTVEVLSYIDSTHPAKYHCLLCGYTWETRPDHFKSPQNYKCPRCKK